MEVKKTVTKKRCNAKLLKLFILIFCCWTQVVTTFCFACILGGALLALVRTQPRENMKRS